MSEEEEAKEKDQDKEEEEEEDEERNELFSSHSDLPNDTAVVTISSGPFEADVVIVNGQQKFTWRQIRGGDCADHVFLRAISVGAPLAGGKHFDFAVDNFHGHRALISAAGVAPFRSKRIGQRQEHAGEQRHGNEKFYQQ